jgi:hypothetical protein
MKPVFGSGAGPDGWLWSPSGCLIPTFKAITSGLGVVSSLDQKVETQVETVRQHSIFDNEPSMKELSSSDHFKAKMLEYGS